MWPCQLIARTRTIRHANPKRKGQKKKDTHFAAWVTPELFWGWVILLGAFMVDATVTLVRRVRRGDKCYEAHRNHAYQYASRKYGAHPPVSLAFGAINLFRLLPIAALVATSWLDGMVGVGIAYLPLVVLAFRFGREKGTDLFLRTKA